MGNERGMLRLENGRLSPRVTRAPVVHVANPALAALTAEWPMAGTGISAGYTYLGQFLAHELVSGKQEDDSRLPRNPRLDLDSVYGSDPGQTFQRSCAALGGCFALGWTLGPDGSTPVRPLDLPRGPDRRALIPDARNDENLIVAQLHCLVLRYHNWCVGRLREQKPWRDSSAETLFMLARLHLISSLHHIVIRDFLATLCDPTVYDLVFRRYQEYIHLGDEGPLPPEFTAAGYRFGHAMVRESYLINFEDAAQTRPRRLRMPEIFALTGRGGLRTDPASPATGWPALPDSHVLDWRFFYGHNQQRQVDLPTLFNIHLPSERLRIRPNDSFRISPSIIPIMGALPNERRDHSIVLRNLNAGEEHGLASGQEVAAHFLKQLGHNERHNPPGLCRTLALRQDQDQPLKTRLLREAGFLESTPLWIFILVEASEHQHGLCLGPLGSLLVCEIMRGAIGRQIRQMTLTERQDLTRLRSVLRPPASMAALIETVDGERNEQATY